MVVVRGKEQICQIVSHEKLLTSAGSHSDVHICLDFPGFIAIFAWPVEPIQTCPNAEIWLYVRCEKCEIGIPNEGERHSLILGDFCAFYEPRMSPE